MAYVQTRWQASDGLKSATLSCPRSASRIQLNCDRLASVRLNYLESAPRTDGRTSCHSLSRRWLSLRNSSAARTTTAHSANSCLVSVSSDFPVGRDARSGLTGGCGKEHAE